MNPTEIPKIEIMYVVDIRETCLRVYTIFIQMQNEGGAAAVPVSNIEAAQRVRYEIGDLDPCILCGCMMHSDVERRYLGHFSPLK